MSSEGKEKKTLPLQHCAWPERKRICKRLLSLLGSFASKRQTEKTCLSQSMQKYINFCHTETFPFCVKELSWANRITLAQLLLNRVKSFRKTKLRISVLRTWDSTEYGPKNAELPSRPQLKKKFIISTRHATSRRGGHTL